MRPALEVADIFRRHGDAFRVAQYGRFLPDQRRGMAAIEACRTATLGGHVEQCDGCGMVRVAYNYNSCRDRHCPKCPGPGAQWLPTALCRAAGLRQTDDGSAPALTSSSRSVSCRDCIDVCSCNVCRRRSPEESWRSSA